MRNRHLFLLVGMLAAECANSFLAGGLAYSELQKYISTAHNMGCTSLVDTESKENSETRREQNPLVPEKR